MPPSTDQHRSLVNIGEVIVNGVIFDPKNSERLRTMDMNELLESVPRLFDLLAEREIDYVLVGGIAMLAYIDGRNTQDINLIVSQQDLEKIPELEILDQNPEFARTRLGDLAVDFLFTHNKLFQQVRQKHTHVEQFSDRQIPCATIDAIVMLKLFALPSLYCQARFEKVDLYQNDVLRLLRDFDVDLEPIFAELAKHMLPSDLEELRSIVSKIETEISDSRKCFSGGQ